VLAGEHPLLGSASVGLGRIDGGTAVNMTPDRCHAEIDVRFLPSHDPDAIERAMAEVAGNNLEIERFDCKPIEKLHSAARIFRRIATLTLSGNTAGSA